MGARDTLQQNYLRINQHLEDRSQEAEAFGHDFVSSKTLVASAIKNLLHTEPPKVRARIEKEFFKNGPLEDLICDEEITEILINAPNQIFFERNGSFSPHNDIFLCDNSFYRFIDKVCHEANCQYDLKTPYANGVWKGFRLHIISKPLTRSYPQISLRRQKSSPWTLEDLTQKEFLSTQVSELIRQLIQEQQNLLVIGPTGCGKTSLLNACLNSLPDDQRIVFIEDTPELTKPNSLSSQLLTRDSLSDDYPEVDASELIKQALRMRPHKLVLGEVRGAEAKDYLLALSTGHSGLCSLHASDPRQALIRLEMLVQMGAPQWSLTSLRRLIALSLNIIVTLGFEGSKRVLLSIHRVVNFEEDQFILETLYEKRPSIAWP